MSWPPAIVVNPPESVLAGIVLWKRRGTALVTVIVKQLLSVGADGVAQAVGPHPSDALTGDDRVPFKPRADVIVTLPEAPQTMLEICNHRAWLPTCHRADGDPFPDILLPATPR